MNRKDRFALTPPMGWNSWDCYGNAVTEEILCRNMDYMAEHLKPYGWQYIVCDIQWYEPTADGGVYHIFADLCMDEYGRLIPAVNRFPSAAGNQGFRAIADRCHSRGLKFGLHAMRGIPRQAVAANTKVFGTSYTARQIALFSSVCTWNSDMYGLIPGQPGAQEYVNSVVDLYASWGVDYIKVDDICVKYGVPGDESTLSFGEDEIAMWRRAIDQCGREIVLSLSPGPAMPQKAEQLSRLANMWRITNDFWDDWNLVNDMFSRCAVWAPYVKEGCWPDCDMLPLGMLNHRLQDGHYVGRPTRLTHDEQQTMMTLWALFRSPLMLGCDLTEADDFTLSLITNRNVLSLLKESRNAHEFFRSFFFTGWTAEAAGTDDRFLAVFNIMDFENSLSVYEDQLGLSGEFEILNMWTGEKLGRFSRKLDITLRSHACALFRFKKIYADK